MIVSLNIRCDWPGCRERLTYDFGTLRPQAPSWKTETDGVYSLHLCPAHNRKTWDAVRSLSGAAFAVPALSAAPAATPTRIT
jgi:hypothetical protein